MAATISASGTGATSATNNRRYLGLFVNVPIGLATALAAPAVLPDTPRRQGRLDLPRRPGRFDLPRRPGRFDLPRRPGRFDLPGAGTGTAGVAALVYGESSAAATSPGASSSWRSAKVATALAAGALLLAVFAVIETRSRHALLPVRLLRDRDRAGANLIMLGAGTAIFGVFFFITPFAQGVWGVLRAPRSVRGSRSCR